jgi:hypothetical protein
MASKQRAKKSDNPTVMATHASSSSAPSEPRLQPLQFNPLHSDGSNFLEWLNDAKTVLSAEDLDYTLDDDPRGEIFDTYKAQALLLIKRHLDQTLRLRYIQINDPALLWTELKSRFNHQETLFLPQARSDWINLRVLDFPDFVSYNSELHRITAQLKLCGQTISENEMIEKTLSTFPPATGPQLYYHNNIETCILHLIQL